MPENVTEAFVLCGGESERLGFAKEMLRVDGMPLAAAMVQKLQRLFSASAVITNHPAYLEHWLTVPVWPDAFPGLGPLAGIHAGLKQTQGGRAFFIACDMPLVSDEIIRRIAAAAERSPAPAVVARIERGPEPLCGVYSTSLLPALEERLQSPGNLSALRFLADIETEYVQVGRREAPCFRDVDAPSDLALLREVFRDVEPLPVRRQAVEQVGGASLKEDILAEERAFGLHVNGIRLVSVLCLPVALREWTTGYLSFLGLVRRHADITRFEPDYEAGRMVVELDTDEGSLQKAVRLQISSTCGAAVYGPALPHMVPQADAGSWRVRKEHVLAVMRKLRRMAPVFARTGATHQAAFSDGENVLHFFEDVGRHNAIDKVMGRCLMAGTDTSRGVLLATGRLNAQMVVKALRQGTPVVATRSAVTAHAVQLAASHGLTVVGFARGGRLNIYNAPERIVV